MSDEVTCSTEIEKVEAQNIDIAQLTISDDIDHNLALLVNIVNGSPGTSIGLTVQI
jgi:hypothetical protein